MSEFSWDKDPQAFSIKKFLCDNWKSDYDIENLIVMQKAHGLLTHEHWTRDQDKWVTINT